MADQKHTPGPNPLESVAGPHTTIDETHGNQGSGMPAVGVAGLGYALPAQADGNIYARPIIVTSVDSRTQRVSGWVVAEPDDNPPGMSWVQDAKMGNPSEPGTCHWLAKNYMGRSDGPGLTPIGSTEVTEDVSEGNQTPPRNPEQVFDPADADKDGTVTKKEQKQHDKGK